VASLLFLYAAGGKRRRKVTDCRVLTENYVVTPKVPKATTEVLSLTVNGHVSHVTRPPTIAIVAWESNFRGGAVASAPDCELPVAHRRCCKSLHSQCASLCVSRCALALAWKVTEMRGMKRGRNPEVEERRARVCIYYIAQT